MKQFAIDGSTWAFDDTGHGRAIVLVHGFPFDRRIWAGVVAELSGTYRVIAVDLPGFGQSTLGKPFTIGSLADGIDHLAQALKLGQFAVAGLSMGGYVCEALADQHPASLSALILVDIKSDADNAQQKQGRDKMIDLVRTAGSKAIADEMLGKLFSPMTIRQAPQTVRDLRAMMEAVPPKTIETALAAMRDRREYTSLLPKLKMPLQVIVGQDDVIAPPTISEAIHQAVPGSTLTLIPAAGHVTPLEQPKLVADALKKFLA